MITSGMNPVQGIQKVNCIDDLATRKYCVIKKREGTERAWVACCVTWNVL